jgi:hypothetical protein
LVVAFSWKNIFFQRANCTRTPERDTVKSV